MSLGNLTQDFVETPLSSISPLRLRGGSSGRALHSTTSTSHKSGPPRITHAQVARRSSHAPTPASPPEVNSSSDLSRMGDEASMLGDEDEDGRMVERQGLAGMHDDDGDESDDLDVTLVFAEEEMIEEVDEMEEEDEKVREKALLENIDKTFSSHQIRAIKEVRSEAQPIAELLQRVYTETHDATALHNAQSVIQAQLRARTEATAEEIADLARLEVNFNSQKDVLVERLRNAISKREEIGASYNADMIALLEAAAKKRIALADERERELGQYQKKGELIISEKAAKKKREEAMQLIKNAA